MDGSQVLGIRFDHARNSKPVWMVAVERVTDGPRRIEIIGRRGATIASVALAETEFEFDRDELDLFHEQRPITGSARLAAIAALAEIAWRQPPSERLDLFDVL